MGCTTPQQLNDWDMERVIFFSFLTFYRVAHVFVQGWESVFLVGRVLLHAV